jgi:hypothetical protein
VLRSLPEIPVDVEGPPDPIEIEPADWPDDSVDAESACFEHERRQAVIDEAVEAEAFRAHRMAALREADRRRRSRRA